MALITSDQTKKILNLAYYQVYRLIERKLLHPITLGTKKYFFKLNEVSDLKDKLQDGTLIINRRGIMPRYDDQHLSIRSAWKYIQNFMEISYQQTYNFLKKTGIIHIFEDSDDSKSLGNYRYYVIPEELNQKMEEFHISD
jgi:hypothetical protein